MSTVQTDLILHLKLEQPTALDKTALPYRKSLQYLSRNSQRLWALRWLICCQRTLEVYSFVTETFCNLVYMHVEVDQCRSCTAHLLRYCCRKCICKLAQSCLRCEKKPSNPRANFSAFVCRSVRDLVSAAWSSKPAVSRRFRPSEQLCSEA